jgi:hypothetical protein
VFVESDIGEAYFIIKRSVVSSGHLVEADESSDLVGSQGGCADESDAENG